MMSFVDSSDSKYIQLASVKRMEEAPNPTELIVNKLVDNSTWHKNEQRSNKPMLDKTSTESVPWKILKKTPPILDSKLRISQQAGSYPANRSMDIRCTLTTEINIGGVDAFTLFDSGLETD